MKAHGVPEAQSHRVCSCFSLLPVKLGINTSASLAEQMLILADAACFFYFSFVKRLRPVPF